ncbi:MAG: lytic transglycosylase domain-containing protein [Candidatus Binatia bacterium]
MRWWTLGLITLGLVISGLPGQASAEIYMYRDRQGALHFSNAPADPGYRRYDAPTAGGFRGARPRYTTARDRARRKAFDPLITDAANRHSVDAALIKAVIRAESDFVPYARSPAGALGLMQLMPGTARMHNVWRIFEPKENIEGGTRHLRLLLDQYNGNVRLALAAYNAGDGAVARHGGIPPYPETIQYLEKVLRFREQYTRER